MHKRFALAAASILLGISSSGHAALSSPSDVRVGFLAAGPAGLTIEGKTSELSVAEANGVVVLTVPLANLTTGISLRDKHMREKYLEAAKYPTAVLTVARTALKVPPSGEGTEGDATGTLQLHGQTKPVTVHYDAKSEGGKVATRGKFHINMNDFGIKTPSYLGVSVKPDVEVFANFQAKDN